MKEDDRKSFVHFLTICTPQQFEYILKTLTKDQLQVIVEILFNVVQGICPISDKNKTLLVTRKQLIREVLMSQLTTVQRRQRLQKIKKLLPIFLKACLQYGS